MALQNHPFHVYFKTTGYAISIYGLRDTLYRGDPRVLATGLTILFTGFLTESARHEFVEDLPYYEGQQPERTVRWKRVFTTFAWMTIVVTSACVAGWFWIHGSI